jgi:glycosyltransferase involved in cell wall biosynthesis
MMKNRNLSVVIAAYNEAARIAPVVRLALKYSDDVIVVDDGSIDETAAMARSAGARVIRQPNAGYLAAVKRGFVEAVGEVVVTMDADGEHRAEDIPRLVKPIFDDEADLVLGKRPEIARPSERFLNWLAGFRVKVSDSGTGFRALRRELARKMELDGRCICGTSVLEAAALGGRIAEVPVELLKVDKPRKTAWFHLPQIWHVLRWLIKR